MRAWPQAVAVYPDTGPAATAFTTPNRQTVVTSLTDRRSVSVWELSGR